MGNVIAYSLFTDFDINLFKSGKHYRLYEKLGSHCVVLDGQNGTYFAVWAPSAESVSVIGDFNYWNEEEHQLNVRWDSSGIWEGFIPYVGKGSTYKYKINSKITPENIEKADPFARRCEHPPKTASIVWEDDYHWDDEEWLKNRGEKNNLKAPYSVYEVHLTSWKKKVEENRSLSYFELAEDLVQYVKKMNFTHVEFMPIMEFPYDPSWGYQITGYFAPTSRLGYPEEFKYLVDKFHENGIGVILDWVPSHFPEDAHGLGKFDGSCLYEHTDLKKGYHPDWKSLIFNYERNEVRAFLISNALFWLDQYHIDGLRVDAVASMIYLDYSRDEGEWDPNVFGGNENLEAISFVKELNETVYLNYPDVQTIAEESTAFPMVSKPTSIGGLGFGMKWMMGWMHDTLDYFSKDTIYRKFHQNEITFSLAYVFTENFMLPLSHDEVVYGKNSIIGRMPGDEWQRFANLRVLYGYMFTHPGTKLLFMGNEIAQYEEWDFQSSLDWNLLEFFPHINFQNYISDLNLLYKENKALHEIPFSQEGFEWISYDDNENSVMSYYRKGDNEKDKLIVICNFSTNALINYRIGVYKEGILEEIFNSDASKYGGSNVVNEDPIETEQVLFHNQTFSFITSLPPLGISVYKYQ
ncbi:1,4-alpha-glucan branching protein GlgB [Flavobacterium jejuense]|uniref:1,4-alpha-glucan branching enzyme GlgB n=1 Tax=Flavobacterium jejuense TaxID=1544455 RepID=A0ABX0IUW9_9FLAO|nr:1,4-alpha-glucan branching protein GlgB [Flavobacterium jejuense]NHN27704.1 1,4-alpha-glucan branching protein GlgB [Flavobacterium jejuense]